jgi:hypothetical protein
MPDNQAGSQKQINVSDHAQVGVIGDHAHIEDGIRFHPAPPPANPTERCNRAAMLQLVRNAWVVGVLEQSLHGAAMLELGKEYTPDAVERPWDLELHFPGQERRPVPHGAPIRDLFDECSGAFLILGEPGSGKTTTLFEIVRDLIARAETDETRYIPVVLNLSSWAAKQEFLEDWLFEELNTKYHIPKRIARPWIENDTLLLLDGLDEVKAESRDKCGDAINRFRQEHLVPLAVCSRTAGYETLTARIHLQGAISFHPLAPAQIDAYLAGAGAELQAVRTTLQQQFAHIVHKFERLRVQQREAERQSEHLFQTLLHRAFQEQL